MRYALGDLELDAARRELRRGEQRIEVQPLVLELLLYLVCHRDRVVPKDELLDKLWADSNVTEASLSRAVSLARKALGDDDRKSPLIRNHPRVGYRFTGAVEERPEELPAAAASTPARAARVAYARDGRTHIAYQTLGEGPVDIVVVHGWILSIQSIWESPPAARFHHRLAECGRVILFDKRGTGLSDRVKDLPGLAQRMEDLTAVLDAAGSERAFVIGVSEGAPMSILFAASQPERVRGLALIGGFAKMVQDERQPFGWSEADVVRLENYIRTRWGEGASMLAAFASVADRPETVSWTASTELIGGSPGAALELWRMNRGIDVRDVLGVVDRPCLVVHSAKDPVIDVAHGRDLAERIPGARYLELESGDHVPFQPPVVDEVVGALRDWIEGAGPTGTARTLLATVVAMGDLIPQGDAAQSALDRVAQLVVAHRGRPARARGGVAMAYFEGPAQAIRCARALAASLGASGARFGLHTSEIELRAPAAESAGEDAAAGAGEPELAGVGTTVALALLDDAVPGEILVTRTLKELVVGSGLCFEDRGECRVAGDAEPRPTFAVAGDA